MSVNFLPILILKSAAAWPARSCCQVKKSKLILCLALILSGGLFGCSTTKLTAVGNTDAEQIKLPIKFAGYRELYAFIANHANGGGDLTTDEKTLFKLAADSTIKIAGLDYRHMPYVYVVESHYFRGIHDEIRGEQGNGQYYILRPLAADNATWVGFELVGILDGNAYTVQHINGMPRFVSYWHLSAGEHPESIYDWNGKYFELAK